MADRYEIHGYDELADSTLLHEADTLTEAWEWARAYVRHRNAGGWFHIACNAVPFDGDFEFSWQRGEGFI